jgi:hypothetical protein
LVYSDLFAERFLHMARAKTSLIASTLVSVFVLASCVTNGREFPSRLDWVQKNKTRQQDVKLVLGDPQFVGSSDGVPAWTYGYYRYRLFGPSHTKEVKFYWNADRTVQSWSFTSSFPGDVEGITAPPPKPASDVTR